MDASTLALLIILALIIISAIYLVSIYNRLQSLKNGAEATLSQVRVAMKKRLDMIEQLVDSIKSYASFERGTLEKITSLRTGLGQASPEELSRIYGESLDLAGSALAVAESYPNLKTSEAVASTMSAIRDVEDEISRHRYTYNNVVQEFNTMLDSLPSSFVASSAHMSKMEYLNFDEDELRRMGYLSSDDSLEPRRPEVKWD
jgi:LemA protein